MHIEAATKLTSALLSVLFLSGTMAQAQSVCVLPLFDYSTPGSETELTDGAWNIVAAGDAYDMSLPDEPLRHFVTLSEADADVAETAPAAPDGEFSMYDGEKWWISDQYEADQLAKSGC